MWLILQSMMSMGLIMLTFVFSQLKHPLAMGFMLLLQTLSICLITGSMYMNFWFSYILFLVFAGGVLVLFIYVTSLASNEMFNLSFKLIIMMISTMIILLFVTLIMDSVSLNFMNNNNELINLMYNLSLKETFQSINKLYNFPTNLLTILLINYLFFTLIVVVKITDFFYGPIRNLK